MRRVEIAGAMLVMNRQRLNRALFHGWRRTKSSCVFKHALPRRRGFGMAADASEQRRKARERLQPDLALRPLAPRHRHFVRFERLVVETGALVHPSKCELLARL